MDEYDDSNEFVRVEYRETVFLYSYSRCLSEVLPVHKNFSKGISLSKEPEVLLLRPPKKKYYSSHYNGNNGNPHTVASAQMLMMIYVLYKCLRVVNYVLPQTGLVLVCSDAQNVQ